MTTIAELNYGWSGLWSATQLILELVKSLHFEVVIIREDF